ncbi:helix-turn-helix domain-containing protein [Pseudomonas protegens]|uniref:helix-turn-helix domain-containing protein n=1 Tax=Pseudomonas protegens TaxID=380021 RepID=UPI002280C011|nr:helix-turn-helix domain-containing protein [Pseudomonas protegens]MCY7261868.1 helix-turn-helix domain-containing protein [Pseudomonas protegens]
MSLRYSFGAVLQLLSTRKGLSQAAISEGVDQTTVSKLELAKSSVSVDTSYALATALGIQTTTLLALAMASYDKKSARETLLASLSEIEALVFADASLPTQLQTTTRINVSSARKRLVAVQELTLAGVSQAEASRHLGLPESTVRRLWRQELSD